jgi:hypothetical protein
MMEIYKQLVDVTAPAPRKNGAERAIRKANRPSKERVHHIDVDFILSRLQLVRLGLDLSSSYDSHAERYLGGFVKRRSHRGEEEAVAHYKALATYYKGWSLGDDPSPIPFTTSKDGYPSALIPFKIKEFTISTDKELMYYASITQFYLGQKTHKCVPDFSSIEGYADDTNESLLKEFRSFLKRDKLVRRLKRKVQLSVTHDVRLTSAQGIYGESFYSIPQERKVLRSHPLTSALYRLNTRMGRNFLSDLMFDDQFDTKIPPPRNTTLRRVSILREPGNKIRYITIGDFFSQNSLLPIHNHVMELLRNIDEDCTYASSEGCEHLRQLMKQDRKPYFTCFDLQNFTDMLPLSLQRVVLEEFVGSNTTEL